MAAELVFESRLSYHVLRQDGGIEIEPVISLQLELASGPHIYASDASVINHAAWSMTIRKHDPATSPPAATPGSIHYAAGEDKARCVIDIHQSPARFGELLEMFKGGHASEITIIVDDLVTTADYSKKWDTAARATLAIQAICFEFPLPQSEG